MLKLCSLCLLVSTTFAIAGAETALEKAVLAKEAGFRAAMKTADTKALEAILSADSISVWPDGSWVDKEGHKASWKKDWKVTKVEASKLKVRTYNGDTAVVTGRLDFEGSWNGKKIDLPRTFTHIWVKQGSDWKLISRHLSNIQK